MARDPFSNPPPAGASGSRFSGAHVIAALAVIALVAFAFGFYAPLSTAQAALAGEYETASGQLESTKKQLESTTQQLLTAQKERDGLAGRLKADEDKRNASAERAVDLHTQITEGLQKFSKAKVVSITTQGASTVVTLDDSKLFRPHEDSPHPPGRKTLCVVAKVIKKVAAGADVVVAGNIRGKRVTNPKLKRDHRTTWSLSATRAVGAVGALARCGIPSERLSAAGFGHYRPNKKADKRSTGELRIIVTPEAQ